MSVRIQLRRDTAQNWASTNPILAQGEVGWEIGTNNYKIGDGSTAWNSLSYIQFGEIPNDGKLTIQKNGVTIAEFTANQSGNTTANILADSPVWGNITGTLSSQTDLQNALNGKQATISDLNDIRSGASAGATALQSTDVVNNTTSSATNKPLSANMGKSLQDQIDNLNARGKYLSIWDCTTGLAMDEPPVNPYTIETGSYFIVGKIASQGGTNYRPNGGIYDKDVPSTTVETQDVQLNATYYWDGTQWRLVEAPVITSVSFSSIAGSPSDNTNLKKRFRW